MAWDGKYQVNYTGQTIRDSDGSLVAGFTRFFDSIEDADKDIAIARNKDNGWIPRLYDPDGNLVKEYDRIVSYEQKLLNIRNIADTLQNSQWHDYTDAERQAAWECNRSLAEDIFNLIEGL